MEVDFTLNNSAIVFVLTFSEKNFSEVCRMNSLWFSNYRVFFYYFKAVANACILK